MRTRRLVAASSATLLLALSACGGGRPSADDLSDSLSDGASELGIPELPDEVADCYGEALADSDVSDETLQAIVDQDEDYEPSEDDTAALTEASTSCAEEMMEDMPDMEDMEDMEMPDAS